MLKLPRNTDNDYTADITARRRAAITEATGADLSHVGSFSFDPGVLPGNIEAFSGVAQVPIGFAGPLLVNGEHAQGEFYVPMATTEGTLVAKLPEDDAPVAMCGEARLMLKVEIDKAAETVRITKEIGKTEADVLKLTAKLEKPGYTDKAPAHLVAKDQAQLAELSDKLGKLKVQLAKLA